MRRRRFSLLVLILGVTLCAVVMALVTVRSESPVLYDGIEAEFEVREDDELDF